MPLTGADDPRLIISYSTYHMAAQDSSYNPKRTKDTQRRDDPRNASSYSYSKVDQAWIHPPHVRSPNQGHAEGQPDSQQKPDFGDGNYTAIVLGSLLLVSIAAGITLALRYKYRKRNIRNTGITRASQNGRSSGHLHEHELPFLTPPNSENSSFLSGAGNGNYNTSPYDTARNPSLKLYDEIPYIRGGELIGSGDSAYLHYKEPEEPPELPPRSLTVGCESDEKPQKTIEGGNGQKANGDTSIFSDSTDSEILIGKDEHSTGEVKADCEASNENDGLNNIPIVIVESPKDEENQESGHSRHTEVTVHVLSSAPIPLTVGLADTDDR